MKRNKRKTMSVTPRYARREFSSFNFQFPFNEFLQSKNSFVIKWKLKIGK